MPDPMWRCPSMGQIQREMVPESEQSLCTPFPEGVPSGSLTRSAGHGGKQEEKPSGVGWDAELHHHTPAAPTPRFSELIGLAEISFHLRLIKRSTAV